MGYVTDDSFAATGQSTETGGLLRVLITYYKKARYGVSGQQKTRRKCFCLGPIVPQALRGPPVS
jgi:hypothetical protein